MNKEVLYRLIERSLKGLSTKEEETALHEWYHSVSDKKVDWVATDAQEKQRVQREIWQYIHTHKVKTIPLWRRSGRVAAIAGGLLVGIFGWYMYRATTNKAVQTSVAPTTVMIASHSKSVKKVLLPDSTLVWLNAESNLQYDRAEYGRKVRNVYLDGEAFFDVRHNKSVPFIVRTRHIHISVLGTAFNVRDRSGFEKAEASLVRGKISLGLNDGSNRTTILSPNQKFVWTKSSLPGHKNTLSMKVDKIVPVHIADKVLVADTAWLQGEVVFDDLALKDILPQLETKYGMKIQIRNTSVAAYRYTGIVKDETIGQVMEALSLIKPFEYVIRDNQIEIK